ncbi:AbfB domain-containing protein [Deinococcus sp.]|uniref:AbfB domain-containing protein n=1 Tax=Deinococcus sp. TaxID=47478 RepID=UPI003B5BD80B
MRKHHLAALFAPLIIAGCGQAAPKQASAPLAAQQLGPGATSRLTTPWTNQAVAAAVPLPEYPRPQLTRAKWLNLNGQWDYTGGRNAPSAQNPPQTAPALANAPERIRVPYPPESFLSGIRRSNDLNSWYKRTFTVPSDWSGQRVLLNFGAVDREAVVYVNGQQVGRHSGGYDAFSFDVTPFLRSGSNDLVVGAYDPTDGDGPLGKQTQNPGGIFYTPTSGIWQTVWLEPAPAARISRLDMIPDLVGQRLRLNVRGENLVGKSVEVSVLAGGQPVTTITASATSELSIPLPNARLWSPDDPFLYDLKVRVVGDASADTVGSYFGMREIKVGTVGGIAKPLLNGKPIFQFGPLDQGFWPDGNYTAPTDEALKSDVQLAKDLGFNMIRKHIKVEPQRWYYWADKLGMLVWQDFPHAWNATGNSAVANKFLNESREIVGEHLSAPSIVTWVIFNESWGDFNIPATTNTVRSWDNSRLLNSHSGINFAPGDTGAGDLIDIHDYPGPIAPRPQNNRPAVLGEYGGNCLRVGGHMWNPASKCPYTTYPDQTSLTSAYVGQVNRLRGLAAQGLSAAVYTETTDVEDELNGFVTYDRQIKKFDFAQVTAANKALVSGAAYLQPLSNISLRSVSSGTNNRFLRHQNDLGLTEVVNANSAAQLKQDASWQVVPGLADPSCISLAAINVAGSYLRHASNRLRIDSDTGGSFKADATFCARNALDGNGGLSLEASNLPGFFVHQRGNEVWLDRNDNSAGFKTDATWAVSDAWWRSSAILPAGEFKSLRVTTPGFDNRFIRHSGGQGFTEVVNAGSNSNLKADATWKLVPGLADPSCYSFESRNFAGEYLRHSSSRISRQRPDGKDIFRQDATFCAQRQPGLSSVRFAAYNFPQRFIRHFNAELWIADGLGGNYWNTSGGLEADTRWAIEAPWAP